MEKTVHLPILVIALLPCLRAAADDKVTYDDHVLPVFQQSCLNCHNPDKLKGGLDLSTYSGAMKGSSGGKIAEPGDAGSKLIAVVMQSIEPKMPPEGDKLSGEHINVLKRWIEGGLLENRGSSARKPSKPKFDTAIVSSPDAKPDGPPPMPQDILLDPPMLAPRASSVNAIASSPWAPLLAVTSQKQVLLFNTDSLELAGILPFPEGDPVSIAFTPNARYLIVGGGVPGKSGITVTFDVATGERMLVAGKEFDSILAADLKPDLSMVATGSPSRLIKMWQSDDGAQLKSIKKHTDWVTALDFSPDGVLLATGDRNGGVWVWEADTGNEFHTLRAHQAAITAAAFRADSNLLATASEDGTVRFWEMNGGSEVKKIDAHPGGVLAFAWARDGSFITAGRDKVVKLWKPDFNLLREFKNQPDLPVAVAFDTDRKRAFAADYRGQISVWEVESGKPVGNFDSNPPSIQQRLVSLREEIHRHPEVIAAAKNAAGTAKQKLEQARQTLVDHEGIFQQSRDHHTAAVRHRGELEQRLGRTNEQLAANREQLDKARLQLESTIHEAEAKRSEIASVDQLIATAALENDAASAELKRLEDENAENHDGVNEQRSQAEAAARALEESRSARAREQGVLAEIESRQKSVNEQIIQLDAGIASLVKDTESLSAAVAESIRAVSDAEVKYQQHETAVKAARDAIGPLENSSNEAIAALAQAEQQISVLHERERFWTNAAINAEAIRTNADANRKEQEAEDLAVDFTALARSIGDQISQLTARRSDLAGLKEQPAAADALQRQIADLETKLAASSDELTKAKRRTDIALPAARALRAKANELKARYTGLSESSGG